MNWLISRTKGDIVIWVVVFFLSLASLLAVYSSTGTMAYRFQQGNTEYYLFKHLVLMGFGLVLMYAAHKIDYKYYSRAAQIMLYISVPLLLITLGMGVTVNEAPRWLTLPGINVSFQTSDLAKLALIMFVARQLSRKQDCIHDLKRATLPITGAVLGICALIAPANLSTAAVLGTSCLLLMFIGRMNLKHLFGIFGGMFVALVLFLFIAKQTNLDVARVQTWISRIENFSNNDKTEEGYQNQQAKVAIASVGIIGKGPGNSVAKNFLPNPYADFIYAIIIEEYGLLGGVFLILLYLLLLYRTIRIVIKLPKAFGGLLAAGLSFSLVLQAFIHMGVSVNIFPVTGLPLPLVSMGGTSLWFTSIAFGIILSVSRDIEEGGKPEEETA